MSDIVDIDLQDVIIYLDDEFIYDKEACDSQMRLMMQHVKFKFRHCANATVTTYYNPVDCTLLLHFEVDYIPFLSMHVLFYFLYPVLKEYLLSLDYRIEGKVCFVTC